MVVPTANITWADWAHVQNHFFVVDLPASAAGAQPVATSTFKATLIDVLTGLDIPRSTWTAQLDATDFSSVDLQGFRLVHSRPQSATTAAKVGLPGLADALRALHVAAGPDEVVRIEHSTSSFKMADPDFLAALYKATIRPALPTRCCARVVNSRLALPAGARIAIMWPDAAEVAAVDPGQMFGRVYSTRPRWNEAGFPRGIFHRLRSKLPSLMHVRALRSGIR